MTKRKYDSNRRAAMAEETRQAIVEAAVKLHGVGITTFSAVADEAGVSLPTVNKYFPTREDLFMACTSHVAAQLEFEPPEVLLAIQNPGERLRRVVHEVFSLHEQTIGHHWTGYKLEDESPVMAQTMLEVEAVVATLASVLPYENAVDAPDIAERFVRAALNPLSYRALRVKNELGFEDAVRNMTIALAGVLNIDVS
jgi:AcrR family transcriptional regulator